MKNAKLNQKLSLVILFLVLGVIFFLGNSFLIKERVIKINSLKPKISEISQDQNQPKNEVISIILVGDIMLDRKVKFMVDKYGGGDYKFPFSKIADYLKNADIIFGNIEGPISDKGKKVGSVYSFRHHPKVIEGLTFAGFDLLSLANNHIFDYGREALEDTFLRLKETKISYVGGGFNEKEAYQPIIKEVNNTKVAFLSYTNLGPKTWRAGENHSGIAWISENDFEKIKGDIKLAKESSDVLIVSLHAGEEYQKTPTQFQTKFAQMAIEAGADLVICHHPHIIQPIEKYKGRYIAYSLGNFVFDQDFSEETMMGQILKVVIENGKIKEVTPLNTKINEYFQPEISAKTTESEKKNKNGLDIKKRFPKNLPGQLVTSIYSLSGIPSPKDIAFSPNGKEFWVASLMNKAQGVAVFDAKTGNHKKDIVLPDGGGVEIIFNTDGSRAYVSQMETGRVFEIDTETKEILRVFETKSSWTKVLALSPREDFIYASNWVGNNVSMIDLQTGQLIRNIPTVATPRGIYVTKNGATLYVAGFGNGEIQKINLETGTSSVLYKSGGAMRHIVTDEEKGILYFSDMAKNLIFKVDMKNDEVKKFVKTDNNPNTIALTPDKKILIVSNRGANHPSGNYNIPGPEWGSIIFFDTTSGKMLDALIAGNQPTGLAVSPDGHYFVYSNFLDGDLTMYEIPPYEEFVAGGGGRSSVYRHELRK